MIPIQFQRVSETVILLTGLVIYILFSAPPLNIYVLSGACILFLSWSILDRFSLISKLLLVPLSVLIATFFIVVGTIQNPTVIGGFDPAADPRHNVSVMARNLSYFIIYPITVSSAKVFTIVSQKATTDENSVGNPKQQSTDPPYTTSGDANKIKPNNNSNNTNLYDQDKHNTKVYQNDEK